ncbi:hypothetical protein [Lactobacillus kullabergensis]|uniref:5-bromo-4-chloroindolyl phosphate hydrolase n=1 Tax=Lactobacillus kullabergensis TaxID=1218493 RepID=A0ABM6VZ27_9LACO|nr:hypothetical protein [Lactobacillus kullabergensis]AWM74806.1 hypothetical protein DKL58_01815 [Lactobacillus kullabergensis]
MIDIDTLDKVKLTEFLTRSLSVAEFQENKSNEYIQLLDNISSNAYGLCLDNEKELLNKYPEIAQGLSGDNRISNYQKEIAVLSKHRPSDLAPIIKYAGIGIALILVGSLPLWIADFRIPIISGLFTFVGSVIEIVGSFALVWALYKGAIFAVNIYKRMKGLPNSFTAQEEQDKKDNIRKNQLIKEYNQLVYTDISESADKTKEAVAYLEDWKSQLSQLDAASVACYGTLCSASQAYGSTAIINRMLGYINQHRAHDFETVANLAIQEIRQEKFHSEDIEMASSVSNDISQMNSNLTDLGEKLINKIDVNTALTKKATVAATTAAAAAQDVQKEAETAKKEARAANSVAGAASRQATAASDQAAVLNKKLDQSQAELNKLKNQ